MLSWEKKNFGSIKLDKKEKKNYPSQTEVAW